MQSKQISFGNFINQYEYISVNLCTKDTFVIFHRCSLTKGSPQGAPTRFETGTCLSAHETVIPVPPSPEPILFVCSCKFTSISLFFMDEYYKDIEPYL